MTTMNKEEMKNAVKKIRKKVTVRLIIFTLILVFLTPTLIRSLNYLVPSLTDVSLFYLVGIIAGFIGLIARSISKWNYIDYKIINKKEVWYSVNEQRKIIKCAYYFKYLIFMIPTILAFISFAVLTLVEFLKKPPISLILVFVISMLIGFIQKSPKDLS